MQTLKDILHSPQGLCALEAQGVFVAPDKFRAQLTPAAKPDLANHLGLENKIIIWSGQQLYVDYRQSVLSKIQCLHTVTQTNSRLFPLFLWADTDRSGSDLLMTKLAWPNSDPKGRISIAPPKTDELELRFVTLNAKLLQSAVDRLGTHLHHSGHKRKEAKDRYRCLRELFINSNPGALSTFNLRLTRFLMANVLGVNPTAVIVSDLLHAGLFLAELELMLNRLPDVIRVFNQTIQALIRRDIDPQVKPLPDDYLPLFFSCEKDYRRLRLSHQLEGRNHFAVADCKCGQRYKFYLGQAALSMAEIAPTRRWSPDVTLPLLLNNFVSGLVAGKSSALYGLVLNQVLGQVLGHKPVPVLVPQSLEAGPEQIDSLIYKYLTA